MPPRGLFGWGGFHAFDVTDANFPIIFDFNGGQGQATDNNRFWSLSNDANGIVIDSNADFVKAMNRKAEQLGLVSTFFADVTGLSNDNKSTAADLAIMSQVAFLNSDINQAASLETYDLNIINKGLIRNIKSTDKILNQAFGLADKIYQVEAGKTGYLEAAGYNFASRVSDNSDRKILVVVLGSETALSRFADTKSLAYWVFNNYQW